MPDSLFLLSETDKTQAKLTLTEMRSAPFESEDVFQSFLAEFPNLLSNHEFGESEPRRWMLVSREQSVPDSLGAGGRWSLDHLFLDQDGVPTLIEVKRASDTRARREVVAQMLDYAANAVVYWPIEDIREVFEATCASAGNDPELFLREVCEDAELDPDEYWRGVESNLRAGRIRMLFVADAISDELLRIVEFLNEQMRPATVLAIEIKHFINGDQRLLSPSVLGQTTKAKATRSVGASKNLLTEEEWLGDYETRNGSVVRRLTDELLGWFREVADEVGLTERQNSFFVASRSASDGGKLRYPLGINFGGKLYVALAWIKPVPGFESPEARAELLERFDRIPGIDFSTKNTNGYPAFPVEALSDPAAMDAFKREAKSLIEACRQ